MIRVVTKIDVSQQTAQDYSVVVTNPPHDCDDPQVNSFFFLKIN